MRTIQVDFDIHKLIETERRSFDESANEALRRLLKLPEKQSPTPPAEVPRPNGGSQKGRAAWHGEGVVLPHGTKLRMVYGRPKTTYPGEIVDGDWLVDGQRYDSPSGAASGVAITGKGHKTRLNGWDLWEVQRPGESGWTPIGKFRKEAARSRKPTATINLLDEI